jgi:hypothetical protein
MARSPLTGIDRAAQEAPGRDEAALGPSDSSDSGSDRAGLLDRGGDDRDGSDPGLPIDVALRDEQSARADRPMEPHPDASDIGVDRIFVPGGSGDLPDDVDAALDGATANDPLEDEEDAADGEEPAPDENEREISAATAGVPASAATVPAPPADPPLPNPAPDLPAEDPEAPNDEGDAEIRKPGRDPAAASQPQPSVAVHPPPAEESSPPPKRRRFVPPRRW